MRWPVDRKPQASIPYRDKSARGTPIGTTWTSPSQAFASALANPAFGATQVTVWSARTVGPSGLPVSQSRPEGTSIARTLADVRVLTAAMILSNGAVTG